MKLHQEIEEGILRIKEIPQDQKESNTDLKSYKFKLIEKAGLFNLNFLFILSF